MRKKSVWETSDGMTFDTQQEAKQHELQRAIADELILQLNYKTETADKIGRDWERILKVIGECRNESRNNGVAN